MSESRALRREERKERRAEERETSREMRNGFFKMFKIMMIGMFILALIMFLVMFIRGEFDADAVENIPTIETEAVFSPIPNVSFQYESGISFPGVNID